MEKNVEISVLCQIYGKVLTEKQYEIINDYYNNDLSLSEIAENNGITRQAVRDIIKKSENKLYELEEKISLMKKIMNEKNIINNIEKELNEIKELTNSKMNLKSDSNLNSNEKIIQKIKNIKKQLGKI